MTPEQIAALPTDALKTLADYHRQTARLLTARAAEIETIRAYTAAADAALSSFQDAARLARRYIRENAMTADASARAAYQSSGVPPETILITLRQMDRQEAMKTAAARRVEVARLAARGLSNNEIAARLHCHRNTVSRYLGR